MLMYPGAWLHDATTSFCLLFCFWLLDQCLLELALRRYAKEVCDAICAKCLTGRPKTVEKAQAAFLLWVELEASEVFLVSGTASSDYLSCELCISVCIEQMFMVYSLPLCIPQLIPHIL
jgi:hypothetical protein